MGDWSLWCSTPTEDIRDRSMWLWETGACGVPHLQRTLETGACGYGRLELVVMGDWSLWLWETGACGYGRLEHVVMGDWSLWLWETGACGTPHLQRTLETGACGYGRLEPVALHTYRGHWRLEHVVMGDWSLWRSTPTEDIRDWNMWLWETGACGVPHLQRTLETGACGYGRLELVALHAYSGDDDRLELVAV